jgi:Tfp pilus assembly protein PilV
MTTTEHTHGFSLAEVLIATALMLMAVTAFALFNAQAARTISTSELATYAADALDAAAQAINVGNPAYTQSRALSAQDLQLLASATGQRAAFRPALSGTITAQNADPPRYEVAITGPGFTLRAQATAPGGSP